MSCGSSEEIPASGRIQAAAVHAFSSSELNVLPCPEQCTGIDNLNSKPQEALNLLVTEERY
jgi:hypothetical protein